MADKPLGEKAIFRVASELRSPEARAVYLRQICGDDDAIHDRIVTLLRVHDDKPGFLESMPVAFLDTPEVVSTPNIAPSSENPVTENPVTEQLGTKIGRYKLIHEIGQGGMGVVYMAVQQEPVKRKVALKIIKPGMDTREVVIRFEGERQALAMMDHPSIARVLDGGSTESGRPYFVMELVDGTPITEYCDAAKYNTRQRLELFVLVCQAVQHAHQKGVIHRDIKPSNILVTNHDHIAVPKVIDFGIAKALHQHLTDRSVYTHVSQMIGTPLYMSPEQAERSGTDVDTRTDVYSLGVLLYELLTGTTPFDKERFKNSSIDEVKRVIQEEEPPRPSTRVSTLDAALDTVAESHAADPHRLSQELSGELDWIVMKALEKDRSRRYESASDFARDVQRHLDDEPVEACPPSTMYRVRKYARRHKGLLTTGSLFAVTLLLATGVSAFYAIQADGQRQQAEEEKGKAVAAEQLAGKRLNQSRRDFQRALDSLDTIVQELASAEFAQVPGMARIRDDMLKKSLTFYDAIIREHDNDPYARQQRAMAYVRLQVIYELMGRDKESLQASNEAIAVLERLIEEDPANAEYRWRLAWALHGRMFMNQVRSKAEMLADAEQALSIAEGLIESGAVDVVRSVPYYHRDESANCPPWYYHQVAVRLPIDSPRARELLEKSIRVSERYGLDPDEAVPGLLGKLAEQSGDLEEAEQFYRRELGMLENLDARPAYLRHYPRFSASVRYQRLAEFLERQKRFDEAEAACRRGLEIARQLFLDYEAIPRYRQGYVFRAGSLAKFLVSTGRRQEAIETLNDLFVGVPTIKDGDLYLERGNVCRRLGFLEQALTDYDKALQISPDDARTHWWLAEVFVHKSPRDLDRALVHAKRAVELDPTPGEYRVRLALVYSLLGLRDEALTAIADTDKSALDFKSHYSLAYAYEILDEFEKSLSHAQKAVEANPDSWESQYWLAKSLLETGQEENSLAAMNKFLGRMGVPAYGDGRLYSMRADILLRKKKYAEALDDFNISIRLTPSASWIYKQRAEARFHLGDYERSLSDLTSALELNPRDLSALTWIPEVVLCQDGRMWKGILELADKAIELTQRAPNAYMVKAQLLEAFANAHHDAGRIDEARPMREEALSIQKEKQGPEHPETIRLTAVVHLRNDRPDEALPLFGKYIQAKRKESKPDDPNLAGLLAQTTRELLKSDQYSAAETYARECVVIREKVMSDHWLLFNAKSMLGGALAGQGAELTDSDPDAAQEKFTEAELLLIAGYEGMKARETTIPAPAQTRIPESLQRLVDLYTAWDKPERAAQWQKLLQSPEQREAESVPASQEPAGIQNEGANPRTSE